MRGEITVAVAAAIGLACSGGPAGAQEATSIRIVVEGVRNADGVVTASLCTREEYAVDDCRLMQSAPALPPRAILSFAVARPGRYAVVVFHDRDRDGEVGRNVLGIPTEGVGFSRDPPLWRRPRFDDVAIDFGPGEREVRVKLRFEPAGRLRRP